ncbi:MAG: LemA family protein [Patescibacteria group bacterium]
MAIGLIIFLAVVGVLILSIFGIYNSLVTLRMRVEESWSQIDVQLKRRADLIPNLVETAKGYMKHERAVFEHLAEARKAIREAEGAAEAQEADRQLRRSLDRLFALAEDNPELRASENFVHLQEELADTEDKIAYARQFYNTNVMEYNTKLQVFPATLVANFFGFTRKDFFQAEEAEREAPAVEF